MTQANFAYCLPICDGVGLPLTLSVFADRGHVRDQLCEDARAAGLTVAQSDGLAALLADAGSRPLGEVVMLDCPAPSSSDIAALMALDLRASQCDAQLIVSTTVSALDVVFGCLDQSQPQLLVDPSRTDRAIALGRALVRLPEPRLRELSEADRLVLLRLTEQVNHIAQRLERFEEFPNQREEQDRAALFKFESPKRGWDGSEGEAGERLVRATRPSLPDPRLVRRIIRQRQLRARFFDGELFADPAWDMLLDLTAARAEHVRVSVTSLCIASGVPPTTALRWIGVMSEGGLLQRVEDDADRRRAFITLTDKAADAMARFFAETGSDSGRMV